MRTVNQWPLVPADSTLYAMEQPQREIRAVYADSTITVYQAYAPEIGLPAAQEGRFPTAWKRDRMTWIKPSFLWMMYRCGWGAKEGQETVLAVEISRAGGAVGDGADGFHLRKRLAFHGAPAGARAGLLGRKHREGRAEARVRRCFGQRAARGAHDHPQLRLPALHTDLRCHHRTDRTCR